MTRDGLVERNETTGEEVRVSQRGQDFQLRQSQLEQGAEVDPRRTNSVRQGCSVREAISGDAHARSSHRRRQPSPPPDAKADAPQTDPVQQDGGEIQPSGEQPETPKLPTDAPAHSAPGLSPANGVRAMRLRGASPDSPRRIQRDAAYRFHRDAEQQPVTHETSSGSAPHVDTGEHRSEQTPPPAERPGRLRFDHTPRIDSAADKQQRSAEYHRRFMEDTARQSEPEPARTDAPVSGDAPRADSRPDETPRPDGRAEPEGSRQSDAAAPSKKSRLQFSPDEQPPANSTPSGDPAPKKPNKKLDKARNKADKSEAKLTRARDKLPTRRRPRLEKTVDAETGKPQRRLQFEKEVKSQRQHLKGPLPLRPVKAGANAAIGYAHKKIYQVEQENVGIEAAHKAEVMAEGVARSAYRFHKTRPYRKVARLEQKATKRAVKFSYQKALHDNPQLKSNIFSRMAQKRKIKRQYAKAARDAKRAGRTLARTGDVLAKLTKSAAGFISRHPAVVGAIAAILLIIFIFMTMLSSCSNMAMGGLSATLASSYLADDADMNAAELVYTEWENELRVEIENVETDYPDFDEYNYYLDGIGHDPRRLMAYLTAVYRDFRYADVYDVLREIFEEQYSLEFEEEVEVRYADPYDSDDDGDREPYNYYILNITLTTTPFPDVLTPRMDDEQTDIHDLIIESGGNRQYTMSPFAFDWTPYISSYFGYRAHPITGVSDFHTGIDMAVPAGTTILAAHDGVVSAAVYGTTGYGYQLTIAGEGGISTRYAHCEALLVSAGQEVEAGDVIARVGSTGDSTGPHLHFEVMKDGAFLNPLYFAQLNTSA